MCQKDGRVFQSMDAVHYKQEVNRAGHLPTASESGTTLREYLLRVCRRRSSNETSARKGTVQVHLCCKLQLCKFTVHLFLTLSV